MSAERTGRRIRGTTALHGKEVAMAPHVDLKPAIVVVSEAPRNRTRLKDALARRFTSDYQVLEETSPDRLMSSVTRLREAATDVALVIAEQRMSEPGTALLGRVRDVLPT